MGNSSGNCPSNIKDQAERCGGFFAVFFPLDSVVTAALRDVPQEVNQREEREDGKREKRANEG